jgi:AAA15 family ATPase/GTPase
MRDFLVSDLPVEREHNIKQKEYAELLQKQKKEDEEKLKLDIVRYNQQYKMDQLAKQKKAQEQERQQAKNKQAAITIQNAVRNKKAMK